MLDFNEKTATEGVLKSFSSIKNERLKELMSSIVTHLHEVVKETEPTFEEWLTAIEFLTRTGHKCDDRRQEFILLSDVLGISMLIDTINNRKSKNETESTVLGPFHAEAPNISLLDICSGPQHCVAMSPAAVITWIRTRAVNEPSLLRIY